MVEAEAETETERAPVAEVVAQAVRSKQRQRQRVRTGLVMPVRSQAAESTAIATMPFRILQHSCDKLDGAPCYVLAIYLQQGKLGVVDEATLGQLLSKAALWPATVIPIAPR